MNRTIQQHWPAFVFMIIILLLGAWYLFSDSMNTYPAYVHAWTQTDRLALAMNFQENGFNLFRPATFNLLTKGGITQVDFPIHDYLVALLSSIFKTDLVFTFRLYNLLYSLVGLFFLFRLSFLLSNSSKRAIFATTFIFTIPFFVYYQNGLIPSAPSFANFLIGLFFLATYHKTQKQSSFYTSVFFITLAALSRSPFFVFLIALFFHRIILQWRAKKFLLFEFVPLLIGVFLFVTYYLFNQQLASTYGSMFLTELLYIDSFETFTATVSKAVNRWGNEILSPFHGVTLLLLLLLALKQYGKNRNSAPAKMALLLYFTLCFMGVILFFFAMGRQFADHDYYYIDTILPVLTILIVLLLANIRIAQKWYTPITVLFGIFFFYFFSYAKQTQLNRYTPPYNDRVEYTYQTYKNSANDLKNWGVEPQDTLIVLDAVSTNMPFTLWGNRGYTVLNSGEKAVQEALKKPFNYVVLIDSSFVTDSFKDYPGLIHQLDLVNSNGELSLYKKSSNDEAKDFFENLIYYGYSDFDADQSLDSSSTAWMQTKTIDDNYGKSYYLPKDYEYALTVKRNADVFDPNKDIEVLILADYHPTDDTARVKLVCSFNQFYQTKYFESSIVKLNQWQEKFFRFRIPAKMISNESEFSLYYWNPDKDELYIDNLKILIYQ